MSSDASRPAKRARRTASPTKPTAARTIPKRNGVTTATTTTPAAAANGNEKSDEAESPFPLYHLPNRDIPPIAPTPPSDCPLGRRRRREIVSRQYDVTSGQPVYRVRVERCVSGEKRSRESGDTNGDGRMGRMGWDGMDGHGTNGDNVEEGRDGADDDAEEHSVGLADILDWVSPAELERFELEWEDDMVFITDEDGAVLLVSREVQRAMMGWPGAGGTGQIPAAPAPPREAAAADESPDAAGAAVVSMHAVGPGKIKKMKKKPTKEFVDTLPPVRRRGRPPKKMLKTAQVMGVVGEDHEEAGPEVGPEAELETVETGSETAEYGAWVNPANVRGTAAVPGSADETDELALSEENYQTSGRWRSGGDMLSREQSSIPSGHAAGTGRRGRSATASTASSHAPRRRATPSDVARPSNMSLTGSPVRGSTSTRGARLRRSSISSGSTVQSFHSASSQRRSLRSSAVPPRSSPEARANNRATSLLSASNFTRQPRSQREETRENDPIADLDATPHASQSTITGTQGSKRRRSSATVHTPSTRHQASSMLHPPAEGASWEPESEEEEYEIESIIDHEFLEGEWYYLVKWANWPPDDVSWFREEQLADARDVLDRYLESVKRKKERAKSRKGKGRAVEDKDEDGDVDMIA